MPKEKMINCTVVRDYWDDDGGRHRSGESVEVPVEAAMDMVESGILSRVKEK